MTMTPFLPPSPISAPNHLLLPLWESPPCPTSALRDRALQTCCPFLAVSHTLYPAPPASQYCQTLPSPLPGRAPPHTLSKGCSLAWPPRVPTISSQPSIYK